MTIEPKPVIGPAAYEREYCSVWAVGVVVDPPPPQAASRTTLTATAVRP
jgi:hypothetical protein